MSKTHLNYLPARLVITKQRWYILYYQEHPVTGERERFRETYDLNRIKDLKLRRRTALAKVKEINKLLPTGFPFDESEKLKLSRTPILEALEVAVRVKNTTDRKRTRDVNNSMFSVFSQFIIARKWENLEVGEFNRRKAIAFLDYAQLERKIGARTYNNYIERMRALFYELREREFVDVNPFEAMKKKKEQGKQRRAFNEDEKIIVAQTIFQEDKWLFFSLILQYNCFIRPIEQRRMRFRMIDLTEGVIRLPANVTKNKEYAIITIPDAIISFLLSLKLHQYNQNHLIFGKKGMPHPDKCCGHNTMNYKHKKVLTRLKDKGLLEDITGLSFYSWKDTGALELFKRKVNILEIMRQLRHKDLNTTQKYCTSLYVINKEIKELDTRLLPEKMPLLRHVA